MRVIVFIKTKETPPSRPASELTMEATTALLNFYWHYNPATMIFINFKGLPEEIFWDNTVFFYTGQKPQSIITRGTRAMAENIISIAFIF